MCVESPLDSLLIIYTFRSPVFFPLTEGPEGGILLIAMALGPSGSGGYERAGRAHEAKTRPFDTLSAGGGFEPPKALLSFTQV